MKHLTRPRVRGILTTLVVTSALAVLPVAPAASATEKCAGVRPDVLGTDRADVLHGTPGDDVIAGLGGNDKIDGRGGNDILCGGDGDDDLRSSSQGMAILWGGPGDDDLYLRGNSDGGAGEAGDDFIIASGRNSGIVGGPGDDTLLGGDGNDHIAGGPGDDDIDAGGGNDKRVDGGSGNDRIDGSDGKDVLRGRGGKDRLFSGTGGGTLLGGPDADELTVQGKGVTAAGDGGADTITGSDHADVIDGGAGNDTIRAMGGDDLQVRGGAGNDDIQGDDGVDTCAGGPGTDTCDGGSPGGPANSPTDPDTCAADVEERISCREAGMPARWKVTMHGTTTHEPNESVRTDSTWEVTAVVEAFESGDGLSWYLIGPGTSGSWSATGTDTDVQCTISGSGTFDDDDLSLVLRIDPGAETYGFQWGGLADTPGSATCGNFVTSYDVRTGVDDEVAGLAWSSLDPTATLSGTRVVPSEDWGDAPAATYSWSISPVT